MCFNLHMYRGEEGGGGVQNAVQVEVPPKMQLCVRRIALDVAGVELPSCVAGAQPLNIAFWPTSMLSPLRMPSHSRCLPARGELDLLYAITNCKLVDLDG